ncbi:MAG: pyridoxal phosphate-dependent aminotransferase [Planctomycetes bacterium]|nr:pyridoxal phosphate-dependent aminotransferase [Planctomycetota bacterium]
MTQAATSAIRLSRRVLELPASQTLALAARAKALKAEGKPVISFSAGEPDFTSPHSVGEAAKAAIDAGQTHYPPVPGTAALKAAVLRRVERETGHTATPDRVLVSTGAKQVLYNLIHALVDPGDEVLYAAPYWVSYPAMVQLAGGRGVAIQTRAADDFRLSPADVEAAIGPKTKALILNSPSNPTGSIIAKADLEAIVTLCLDRGVVLISDEIYGGLIYGNAKHESAFAVSDPRLAEGVVLVDGVSKVYAMTGWRIGYAVGPPTLIKAAAKLQGQSTSGACAIAQAAAAAALDGAAEDAERMRQAFERRCALAKSLLSEIPDVVVPNAQGAFYVFPDFSAYFGKTIAGEKITGSLSLSELLLDKINVAAVPGVAFGADNHLRFSYALADDELREGLARVKTLLSGE